MNFILANCPVGLSQWTISSGWSEKMPAGPYESDSIQSLMKLSWQEAHLRFTPMNTWEMFCAAWICGVWLALTTPRQTMPLLNPSESALGLIHWATNWSYGKLFARAA